MPDPSPDSPLSTFRLRRRTPGTFVLVPYPKQGRSIRCQGQLEAAAAQILAACPLVTEIHEQPLSIWYAWDAKTMEIKLLDGPPTKEFRKAHRTSYVVPDFLVTMHNGARRLIEAKPSEKLERPLVQRKLSVARLAAQQRGWTYHIVTECRLFTGPLLRNVRLLGRFRHLRMDSSCLDRIDAIVAQEPITIEELARQMGGVDIAPWKAAALHLVAVGRLAIDLRTAPISAETLLYPGGTLVWDPFDSVWGPSGSSTNGCFASSVNSAPKNSLPKI